MKKLLVAAFALALTAPSAARAQAYVGGRIGYAIPFGTAYEVPGAATPQKDLIKSSVPIQGDAGLRLGPIELGAYFSYGFFAKEGSNCGGDCSVNEIRIGLQANLHSPLMHEREVWGGILLGYERLKISPGSGADATASGYQLGVQGGYDFAGSTFGVGPFVTLTAGQYDTIEFGNTSLASFSKRIHGEVILGVRGFFKIL